MKLTTKGRYAVMAMADLALFKNNGPTNLTDISLRQNISLAYLEQIFIKLKKNKRSELISINHKLEQNAAFRIMKYNYAFQNSLSTFSGGVINNAADIHFKSDLKKI